MSLISDTLNSSLVCRLCIKLSDSVHPIDYIRKPLEIILPNLELSLTNEPVVCSNCVTLTTQCHTFITMCLESNKIIRDHYNKMNFKTVDLNLLLPKNSKSSIKPSNKIKHELKNTSVEKHEQNNMKAIQEYQDRLLKSLSLKNGYKGHKSTVTVEKNNLKTKKEYQDLLLKSTIKNKNMQQKIESNNIIEIFETDIISDGESDISEDTPFEESFSHQIVGPAKKIKTEETEANDFILITDSENELGNDDSDDDYDMKFVEEFDFSKVQNLSTVNKDNEGTADNVVQSLISQPSEENILDVLNSRQLPRSDLVFSCSICRRNFSKKLHLHGHILSKHKDVPHVENIVTSKIHYCPKCPYRTINSYSLAGHLENKHNMESFSCKKFLCAHCEYSTKNKGNLITHLRIHKVLEGFPCEYCEKSFNQKRQLQMHILRYHADIPSFADMAQCFKMKIFTCKKCPYKTFSYKRYINHLRLHNTSTKKGRPRNNSEKAL